MVIETWWFGLCWRPSVLLDPSVRPNTLSDMNDTWSLNPADDSCDISEPIAATPVTCCAASLASAASLWLSPPNGMWIATTGVTLIWISVTAAVICDATLLSLICLLYTSDAADERSSVDLGGR